MTNKNRTTRIALRCTPTELDNIALLAAYYGLPTADFIRQAIVIAVSFRPLRHGWRLAHAKALDTADHDNPRSD